MTAGEKERAIARLRVDNPWWGEASAKVRNSELPKRGYFDTFYQLVEQKRLNRAVVLMGPRRVGKTVMMYQAIDQLFKSGIDSQKVLFASLETPSYIGLWPEDFLALIVELNGLPNNEGVFLFLDEIQYFKDWEVHLKSLVDTYPACRFVVSGSAAAALKMASKESGLGRFSDFTLPPLLFAEYLELKASESSLYSQITPTPLGNGTFITSDIEALNVAFFDYINFGGFPEFVYRNTYQNTDSSLLKSDILDKALQRDLPSLYGIDNVQDVYKLFSVIAFKSGQEFSFERLSNESGLDHDTIRKYLTFLEAAFLIKIIDRLDTNAKRFKRITSFKAYLTNPTMRTALFGPVDQDDEGVGHVVEAALFAQFLPTKRFLNYARWDKGEVDLVASDSTLTPRFVYEFKWSDAYLVDKFTELKEIFSFTVRNNITNRPLITTRRISKVKPFQNLDVYFAPCAILAYSMSQSVISNEHNLQMESVFN